jgi:hypothetical protein
MKRIPFTLLVAVFTLAALSACFGGSGDADVGEQDAEAAAETLAAMDEQAAVEQTEAAAEAPPPAEEAPPAEGAPPPEEAAPGAETATPTQSTFELTLAALATEQAPTIWWGETRVAETQTAMPTATPLVFEVLSSVTTETITENDVEVTVTAIAPPSKSLAQSWTEIYAAPAGLPFTLTTDEEAMALAIQNSMAAAGHGDNVSDLTVSLNNNLVTVAFTTNIGGTGADGRISFAAFAQNGEAVITMTSLQFGRFTVPPEILDAVNIAIAQALTGAGDASQAQVTIEDIFIDDGQMIVTGIVGIEGTP